MTTIGVPSKDGTIASREASAGGGGAASDREAPRGEASEAADGRDHPGRVPWRPRGRAGQPKRASAATIRSWRMRAQ